MQNNTNVNEKEEYGLGTFSKPYYNNIMRLHGQCLQKASKDGYANNEEFKADLDAINALKSAFYYSLRTAYSRHRGTNDPNEIIQQNNETMKYLQKNTNLTGEQCRKVAYLPENEINQFTFYDEYIAPNFNKIITYYSSFVPDKELIDCFTKKYTLSFESKSLDYNNFDLPHEEQSYKEFLESFDNKKGIQAPLFPRMMHENDTIYHEEKLSWLKNAVVIQKDRVKTNLADYFGNIQKLINENKEYKKYYDEMEPVLNELFGNIQDTNKFKEKYIEVLDDMVAGKQLCETQKQFNTTGNIEECVRFLGTFVENKYFQVPSRESILNSYLQTKEKQRENLEKLKEEEIEQTYNANKKETKDYFGDLGNLDSEKTVMKKFNKALDKIVKGKINFTGFDSKQKLTAESIGFVAGQLVKIMSKQSLKKDMNAVINAAYAKLDPIELTEAFRNKFLNEDLKINQMNGKDLSIEENNNKEINGIAANAKNIDLAKDAIATYARLDSIHNSRGFFYKLFHYKAVNAESVVLESMKNKLKASFNLDDNQLETLKKDNLENGLDIVSKVVKSVDSPIGFKNKMTEFEKRENARNAYLNTPEEEFFKDNTKTETKKQVEFKPEDIGQVSNSEVSKENVITKNKDLEAKKGK